MAGSSRTIRSFAYNVFLAAFSYFILCLGATGLILTINSLSSLSHLIARNALKIEQDLPVRHKCLDGKLQGTAANAGLGNIVFELVALIGIATVTGRLPIITHKQSLNRIEKHLEYLPEVRSYLKKMEMYKRKCANATTQMNTIPKCCVYDNSTIENILKSKEPTIHINMLYTQGITYVQNAPAGLLKQLLNVSSLVRTEAQNLFPANVFNNDTRKICVHIRLGDFTTSPLVYPSFGNFTVAAVNYVLNSDGAHSTIFVFSNDPKTSSPWFKQFQNAHHATFNKTRPANTEWEFSRLYCDVVIMTAAPSTYGWWMGFLSKGQKVYYNRDFSRPNGIEKELNPKDFWPSSWIPLKLEGNTTKVVPW